MATTPTPFDSLLDGKASSSKPQQAAQPASEVATPFDNLLDDNKPRAAIDKLQNVIPKAQGQGANPAPPAVDMQAPGYDVPAPAGKLSGLPGVDPHTPTNAEMVGDVALASAPLAAGAAGAASPALIAAGKTAVEKWQALSSLEKILIGSKVLDTLGLSHYGGKLVHLLGSEK